MHIGLRPPRRKVCIWGSHIMTTAQGAIHLNEPSPGLMSTILVGYNIWPRTFVLVCSTRPVCEPLRSIRLADYACSLCALRKCPDLLEWGHASMRDRGRVGWLHRCPTSWHHTSEPLFQYKLAFRSHPFPTGQDRSCPPMCQVQVTIR